MVVVFTLMALGGGALMWRIDHLNNADRDLTPDQRAALSKSIIQFLGVKFQVHTLTGDREAQSLATKIVDAVKAGSGTFPQFVEVQALPTGVVLVFSTEDTDLRRAISDTVGRRLAAARIAVDADFSTEQPKHSVKIIIGKKP